MRIGIDIGGTKAAAVVVDDAGAIHRRASRPSGQGREDLVAGILALVRELGPHAPSTTLGIGVPGPVDPVTGRVENAVNLGVTDFDLGAVLSAELGLPVRIDNDVKAAALGAHRLLGGDSLAYLNLGTGLAVGVVEQGHLLRGRTGVAGEIGHIPVEVGGLLCRCGQRGCLETVASGGSVGRRWPTRDPVPPRDLFACAARGDIRAVEIRDALLGGVATAVQICVLSWDVEQVILGGGLTGLGAPLIDGVREALADRAATSSFLRGLGLPARVAVVPDGYHAAAVGAALVGAEAGPGGASGEPTGHPGAGPSAPPEPAPRTDPVTAASEGEPTWR